MKTSKHEVLTETKGPRSSAKPLAKTMRRRILVAGMNLTVVLAAGPAAVLTSCPTRPVCNGTCNSPLDTDDCAMCCGSKDAAYDCCDQAFVNQPGLHTLCQSHVRERFGDEITGPMATTRGRQCHREHRT